MKLIFLGPPGAGKGTHAQILSKKYKLVHLATGDILRKNIRAKTDIGLKAKEIIEKGELVSDDIINNMMFEEMKALGDSKGIILDGFPRTLGQAMALDEFLVGENETLRAVVNIDTSEEVIVKRLSGRRISPGTGRVYHIHNLPPKKDGICDDTGEKLSIRKDDEPETVRKRLTVYKKETAPLIEFYENKGLLNNVPGDEGIEKVQASLTELFEKINLIA